MPGSADEGPLQPDSTAAAPAWWCSDAGATTRRTGLARQGSADFSQSQHGYRSYPEEHKRSPGHSAFTGSASDEGRAARAP